MMAEYTPLIRPVLEALKEDRQALVDEIERLRQRSPSDYLFDPEDDHVLVSVPDLESWNKTLTDREAEIERLRRFARHAEGCLVNWPPHECGCGFDMKEKE